MRGKTWDERTRVYIYICRESILRLGLLLSLSTAVPFTVHGSFAHSPSTTPQRYKPCVRAAETAKGARAAQCIIRARSQGRRGGGGWLVGGGSTAVKENQYRPYIPPSSPPPPPRLPPHAAEAGLPPPPPRVFANVPLYVYVQSAAREQTRFDVSFFIRRVGTAEGSGGWCRLTLRNMPSKLYGSRRACVDVGTPRFRLQIVTCKQTIR